MDDGATDQREEWKRGVWKVSAPGGGQACCCPPTGDHWTGLTPVLSISLTDCSSVSPLCLSLSLSPFHSLPVFLFISISYKVCIDHPYASSVSSFLSLFSLSLAVFLFSDKDLMHWTTLVEKSLIRMLKKPNQLACNCERWYHNPPKPFHNGLLTWYLMCLCKCNAM